MRTWLGTDSERLHLVHRVVLSLSKCMRYFWENLDVPVARQKLEKVIDIVAAHVRIMNSF